MVLRLMLLKHVRNWSFDALEREVRTMKKIESEAAS
jgi:hypothetical protein